MLQDNSYAPFCQRAEQAFECGEFAPGEVGDRVMLLGTETNSDHRANLSSCRCTSVASIRLVRRDSAHGRRYANTPVQERRGIHTRNARLRCTAADQYGKAWCRCLRDEGRNSET